MTWLNRITSAPAVSHSTSGAKLTLRTTLACAVAVVALNACNLAGPAYTRPEVPEKQTWTHTAPGVNAAETIQPEWWHGFRDSYLDRLVDQAIAGGLDLRVLAARIDVAGAAVGAQKATVLPTLSGKASANVQQSSTGTSSESYEVGAALNWEIDIWGKARKGIASKEAEYKASEADWRAGYLTLVSDVAEKYFSIRLFDEQMSQQQATVDNQKQLLAIYRAQYREGLIPESQLLTQQAEISRLTTQLVELKRQRDIAENQIATLLGVPAGELKVPVAPLTKTVSLIDVPSGLPSGLLQRRPDIIAQEYRVLAAHELVGQARLARLPSFSLTGSAGSSSTILSGLLKTWTFGLAPAINIPIFDPNVQAAIRTTSAQAKLSEEEYRRTVIRAFEEVENALVNLASRKHQRQLLEQEIRDLLVVRQVQSERLKEGLVSQLEVLETERTLLSAQQGVLQTHQQILTDTVTLYKALGGGWGKESVAQAAR